MKTLRTLAWIEAADEDHVLFYLPAREQRVRFPRSLLPPILRDREPLQGVSVYLRANLDADDPEHLQLHDFWPQDVSQARKWPGLGS